MAGGLFEGPSYGTGLPVDSSTGANLGPLPGLGGASSLGLTGLGAEGLGLGASLYGAFSQAKTVGEEANLSVQKAGIEQQQNQVRWNQARMAIRNSDLQSIRNAQQSRSLALTNAVGGTGTTQSSELGGALGQIGGEEGTTKSNLSSAYQFGQQEYNLNNQLSALEIQQAGLQKKQANQSIFSSLGAGLSSLGSSLVGASTGGSASALASLAPLLLA